MHYHSLTEAQLREIEAPMRRLLRDFNYRPGWKFEVRDGRLRVRAAVVDADNPSHTCPLSYEETIPDVAGRYNGTFDWVRWLFEFVKKVEMHELREFFQVRGVKVYDPHA